MTNKTTFSGIILAAIVLIAVTGPRVTHAAPVIWTLEDVKLQHDGKAEGFFAYDAALGLVTDWDIQLTGIGADVFGTPIDITFAPDPSCSGQGCDSATKVSVSSRDDLIFMHGSTPSQSAFLSLVGTQRLSDAGGIIPLALGTPPDGSYLSCCAIGDTLIVSGTLVSVPEPSHALMIVVGVLAMGSAFLTRQRRSNAKVMKTSAKLA